MKILFGMPEKTAQGGINACEPPFIEALKNLGAAVREEIYVFDHKTRQTKPFERVGNVLNTARKFRKILRENEFDVLHLNTAFDLKAVLRDAATVDLIKTKRTRIFLKMHGSEAELLKTKSLAKRALWRRLLKQVDGIGVLSGEEKKNFVRAGVAENKIFVVKNAVRLPENLPSREFYDKPFRLVFASRFIPEKGLIETVRAVARLRRSGIDVVLDCLGDGADREPAEKLVDLWQARDFIRFHGFVAEEIVSDFYQNSDALIFPTRHAEGFPMVIFSAMAHGLPVVTTRIRAAADYLFEPENVLWTTHSEDSDDLCRKIDVLYKNPELCRLMSENNRKSAADFTAEKIAPEYLEIYRKLIRRS